MKERPIIFNGEMVRAILDGRKVQTRRPVKGLPDDEYDKPFDGRIYGPEWYEPEEIDRNGESYPGDPIFGIYTDSEEWGTRSPYGAPGDRLWARETWREWLWNEDEPPGIEYRADERHSDILRRWRPSIHMPRWASRITLEITKVGIERIQEISEEDARAEGAPIAYEEEVSYGSRAEVENRENGYYPDKGHYFGFRNLWNSIYEKKGFGWDKNPYVWVYTFKRAG